MPESPLPRPTVKELLKAVFWNRWGTVVGSLLAVIGITDLIDAHFAARFGSTFKAFWDRYYVLPSFGWRTWVTIVAVGLLIVAVHGAYLYAISYYRRFEKLIEHNLVFEIDQRWKSGTKVMVEKTGRAMRIYLALELRFENRGDAPRYMKTIKVALHRRGDADAVWTWFTLLSVTNNGNQIDVYDFEPMRVDGHQLTDFYLVRFMLSTPDDETIELDANYFLRFSMEASDFQSVATADLNPYWDEALREGGTNQISIITDAKLIPEDYNRIY